LFLTGERSSASFESIALVGSPFIMESRDKLVTVSCVS
jgi:hypothetical protein